MKFTFIYFAERFLFPHLLRPPGKLPFITVIKFDFFCFSVSNLKTYDIYCLPEFYCSHGKTSDEVTSKVKHSIRRAKYAIINGQKVKALQIREEKFGVRTRTVRFYGTLCGVQKSDWRMKSLCTFL